MALKLTSVRKLSTPSSLFLPTSTMPRDRPPRMPELSQVWKFSVLSTSLPPPLLLTVWTRTHQMRNTIEDKEKLKDKLEAEDKKTIEDALKTEDEWMKANEEAEKDDMEEHFKSL